jgi:hypothetical protein
MAQWKGNSGIGERHGRILADVLRMRAPGVVLAMVLSLLAACGGSDSTGRDGTLAAPPAGVVGERGQMSLDEVYGHMEQALARKGQVLHARLQIVDWHGDVPMPNRGQGATPGPTPDATQFLREAARASTDLWIDAANGVGRREWRPVVTGPYRSIVRADDTFAEEYETHIQARDSLHCRGSDSVFIAMLMDCRNYIEKSSTTVMQGRLGDADSVVLVTEGTSPDEDAQNPFRVRLFVDASTWLPLAAEQDATYGGSTFTYVTAYETDFIARSGLAADFFEPASIGYVEPDPEAGLNTGNPGVPVYWLGRTFSGGGSLPNLALQSGGVTHRDPRLPPLYRVTLNYGDESVKHGPPLIGLQIFAAADWTSPSGVWDGAPSETIDLVDGHGMLFRIPASWSGERYVAQVFLPDVVIVVTDFDAPSAYNTRAGFTAVVKGLTLRRRPAEAAP